MSTTTLPTPDLAVDAHRVVAGKPVAHTVRVRGTQFAHVDVADRFAREYASIDVLELWPEVGHQLGDGTADALLDRQAVNVGQYLIDSNDPQIAIDQLETDRSGRLDAL
jgi:hypothetical protein